MNIHLTYVHEIFHNLTATVPHNNAVLIAGHIEQVMFEIFVQLLIAARRWSTAYSTRISQSFE